MAESRTGCVLLRELPPRPTQRSCKISTDLEQASSVLDSAAFQGAPVEQQQRLQVFQSTWGAINHVLTELRQHHLSPIFSQLQQWAADSAPALQDNPTGHASGSSNINTTTPSSSAAAAAADAQLSAADAAGVTLRQLPLALLSMASSTNVSDTYVQLKVSLRKQGHPVSLITPREAAAGLPAVISSTMRQYMPGVPEAKAADDVPALLAWWQDEWQQAYAPAARMGSAAAPAGALQTPTTASKARSKTSSEFMAVENADAAAGTAGTAAAAAAATPGRELRARPGLKTPGKPGAAAGPALAVPVVVLQDADTEDMETLEELVVAFSEARTAGLPLVVVLGVSSSPACLLQLLPNALLRRVSVLSLALPPARQQLVHICRALLLRGPQPPLLLGPRLAAWLLQHFRDADCSASMAERVVQLACVEHFRGQPLSCLAAAAASGRRSTLAAAVAALPQQQLMHCCRALLAHPAVSAAAAASITGTAASLKSSPADKGRCSDAAIQQLRLFADSNVTSSNATPSKPSAAAAAAAAGSTAAAAASVLEGAVWDAMQAFGRWRLAVLLLSALAQYTGVADVDASFQLPSLFAAASQPNFLVSKHKGSLSPCGLLLLKLLGGSSNSSSSSSNRRCGVTTVQELHNYECMQLLQSIQQLVAGGAGLQGEQSRGSNRDRQKSSAAAAAMSEAGSESESDSESDSEALPDPSADSAVARCPQVQQLQHALQALQHLAAAAAAEHDAAGAKASADEADALESPQKKSKRDHNQQQQQQQSQAALLAAYCKNFTELLTPLPEQLEQAAAAGLRHALLASASEGGTPASVRTPTGRTAAKGSTNSGMPTPGGLASALRKQVRFAPDTPTAPKVANGKNVGSLSAHSTPDDVAAVAGHINTPNKRRVKKEQPRKALFTQTAAAVAAAAAAAEGGRGRKVRKAEKQREGEGEIAGMSAANLAAVAAAAASGSAGSPQVPAVAGNKRSQRLMQLLSASGDGTSAGSSRVGSSGSHTPVAAAAAAGVGGAASSRRTGSSGRGLLSTPTQAEDPGAAVASSPEGALLSPRGSSRGSAQQLSAAVAAAAGAVTTPVMAAVRGATRSSRLSRQSLPQQSDTAAVANDDTVMGADETLDVQQQPPPPQQQQQQQGRSGQVAPAASASGPDTCSSTLSTLLSAIIPKLLHDWCSFGSSSSSGAAPLAAAGAASFVFDDADVVSNLLCAAPRCAVHAALTEPAKRMPGHPVLQGPGWEDTCLAYVLLQQQREDSIAVSDWFGMFCQAWGVKGLTQGSADDDQEGVDALPGVGRAAKARDRAGRKARGYAEARQTAAAASGASAPAAAAAAAKVGKAGSSKKKGASSSSKDRGMTPQGSAQKHGAAAARSAAVDQQHRHQEVDEQQLLAAAACFCQSVAELQHLGVWKATKRRRLAAVQRVFAPEGPGMVLRYSSYTADAAVDSLPDHNYDN